MQYSSTKGAVRQDENLGQLDAGNRSQNVKSSLAVTTNFDAGIIAPGLGNGHQSPAEELAEAREHSRPNATLLE